MKTSTCGVLDSQIAMLPHLISEVLFGRAESGSSKMRCRVHKRGGLVFVLLSPRCGHKWCPSSTTHSSINGRNFCPPLVSLRQGRVSTETDRLENPLSQSRHPQCTKSQPLLAFRPRRAPCSTSPISIYLPSPTHRCCRPPPSQNPSPSF